MTTEEKKLLLKDICARLPYEIILDVDTTDWKEPQGHIKVKIEGIGILFKDMSLIVNGSYYGDKYKPYLRPMSSMTEKEKKELRDKNILIVISTSGTVETTVDGFDWLNAHHFDYRGLIEKGLALEATEGMYKF